MSEHGFTLLEMLVTLSIAALLAGIGFPALERMLARQALASGCADLQLALVQARAAAVGGSRAVRVMLGEDRRTVLIDGRAPVALGDTVSVNWPQGPIAFFADGSASGGSVMLSSGARACRFRVDPITAQLAVAA